MLASALVVLFALGSSACGDSTSSPSSSSADAHPTSGQSGGKDEPSGKGDSAPPGSAGFIVPGGDNSIQNFGEEASAAEREEASAVLATYMRAQVAGDRQRACTMLAKVAVKPLQAIAGSSPSGSLGCAAILTKLYGGSFDNTMTGPIGSLRVEGDRGFALYHGTAGVDYLVPMTREDGEWKVSSLSPVEL